MTLTFANACVSHVLQHGPLPLEELHRLALAAGTTRSKTSTSLRQSLTSDTRFVVRPDGSYDTAARLLRGSVLTLRPTGPLRDGVLWLDRDLDPLLSLDRDRRLPLAAGGVLVPGQGVASCWTGPPGWADAAAGAPLIGLRWDGVGVDVVPVHETVAPESARAQQVRRILARHALQCWRTPSYTYGQRVLEPLTRTVLSALVEAPDLLAEPLPPLSELLPLPEELRPQDTLAGQDASHGHPLTVLLPHRVADELGRRADLLGERLPEYVSMVLSAAADRLQVAQPPHYDGSYGGYLTYQGLSSEPMDVGASGEVVDLRRWSR